jgi:putative addiction module antidote
MTQAVKIRKIGNSLGVTLSEQVRELGLKEGDSLYVVKTATGFELTPFDPDFAEALDTAREFMRAHPNAMKALAE